MEIDYASVLTGLGLTAAQFVDVCILCGCDYLDDIKGCGPVTALKLIKDHGSIEAALPAIAKNQKFVVPPDWDYKAARALFTHPDVSDVNALPEFKWTAPDEEGLLAFLVGEKTFAEDRVVKSIEKMKLAKSKATQNRMESFFGAPVVTKSTLGKKRELEAAEGKGKGKAKAKAGEGGKKSKGVGSGGGGKGGGKTKDKDKK